MNSWQELTDMIELQDVNSEVNKKYKDTYLRIDHTDDTTQHGLFIGNHNDENYLVRILSHDDSDKEQTILVPYNHNDTIKISIPKPKVGCYTSRFDKDLFVFNTLPHRQWKKGLCKGNSMVRGNHQSTDPYRNYHNTIKSVVDPLPDCTLTDAIKFMNTEKYYGRALNREFGITLNYTSMNDSYFILFYKQFIVGKVLRNKEKIIVENQIFLQEVIDAKPIWFPNYEIKVNDNA